jgi:hypothetical protein
VRRQLGYALLIVGVVGGLLLLSVLVGDRGGAARIAWLVAGLVLGGLWALRGQLPVLDSASPRTAVGGWLGLVLAGVVTVALAPTVLAPTTASVAGAATTSATAQRTLRPAPPTAVRRTGTVVAAAQARPKPKASPSPPAAAQVDGTPEAGAAPKPGPVLPPGFDPNLYLGQGNAYDCDDLASQAEAQAILRADPTDPNVIDQDRDGLACESNPAPRDTRRVPRSAS